MNKRMMFFGAVVFCVLSMPVSALMTYSFTGITNNNSTDVDIGESQLFLDVSDAGAGQVLFTFRNEGPEDSSITDVYIDDGTYLSLVSIDDSESGVSFSEGASPGNLPGGNAAGFEASISFDSDPAVQPNGVNPGETLGLLFDIQSGLTYDDIINGLNNSDLIAGIHVQGFATGGSEGFVTHIVPAPGALLLGGIGTLAVAGLRTIKNKKT